MQGFTRDSHLQINLDLQSWQLFSGKLTRKKKLCKPSKEVVKSRQHFQHLTHIFKRTLDPLQSPDQLWLKLPNIVPNYNFFEIPLWPCTHHVIFITEFVLLIKTPPF